VRRAFDLTGQFFDFANEVKIGAAFWNFVGGRDETYGLLRSDPPSGSTETATARGETDESSASRFQRKSPDTRSFSVAGL